MKNFDYPLGMARISRSYSWLSLAYAHLGQCNQLLEVRKRVDESNIHGSYRCCFSSQGNKQNDTSSFYIIPHYWRGCLSFFLLSLDLELHVHNCDARWYKIVGGRSHELRRHCNEFFNFKYNRQSSDKSNAEEKISLPGMHEYGNAFRRFDAHGRAYSMYQQIHRYLWNYATQIGRISRWSGTLQRSVPGQT